MDITDLIKYLIFLVLNRAKIHPSISSSSSFTPNKIRMKRCVTKASEMARKSQSNAAGLWCMNSLYFKGPWGALKIMSHFEQRPFKV